MSYGSSIYLGADGIVYGCGANHDGEAGLGDDIGHINIPTEIKYFTKNGIKIVDIKSGCYHNLGLDQEGRVYSFGYNTKGQCGDGCVISVTTPKLIKYLKEYKIVEIKCGQHMSYCKSECGRNFLWGTNDDHECLKFDDQIGKSMVTLPYQIDDVVLNKCDCKSIVSVYPGYYCTKIIVC